MNRRGFLAGILALGIAPALVRAHSLMPVRVLDEPRILTPDNPLFTGELGRYEGVRFHEGNVVFTEPEFFDYGNQFGIGIKLPDGTRHACRGYGRIAQPQQAQQIAFAKQRLLAWANGTPRIPRGLRA